MKYILIFCFFLLPTILIAEKHEAAIESKIMFELSYYDLRDSPRAPPVTAQSSSNMVLFAHTPSSKEDQNKETDEDKSVVEKKSQKRKVSTLAEEQQKEGDNEEEQKSTQDIGLIEEEKQEK
jgi:hypothetical protein